MNVSILQWNVWNQEDIHNIAKFLKTQSADIVCLQELTINYNRQTVKDTPAFIAKVLGYEYYCQELPIESTDGKKVMLADGIFSRFPILETKSVWINQPKFKGGYDDEYRAYVAVTLSIGGTKLDVATTHMSYTDRFTPTPSKICETDQLLRALKTQINPLIFAGDLNALPDSYTIKSISSVLSDAGPDNSQNTWTTKPFSYRGFEENDLNWRLDYIFTSPEIKVTSSRILRTKYSDHLPIKAEIEIL